MPATILDLVDAELEHVGVGPLTTRMTSDEMVKGLEETSGFGAARSRILEAKGPQQFEAETGFAVSGARVTLALATRRTRAEILDRGDGLRQAGSSGLGSRTILAASVILGFEDRSGTVIAALPGYVGTVVVDGGRVTNVSYVSLSEHLAMARLRGHA